MAINHSSGDQLAQKTSRETQSLSDRSAHEVAKLKSEYDIEGQEPERRNSRVAPIHSNTSSDRISVSRQVELEAENAIKYRTCSWQKVRCASLRFPMVSLCIVGGLS